MKKTVLLLAAFSLMSFTGFSQLSGFAFIAGQTNHSGIKVKFNAHPGTAISDSTTTSSTGSYSVNITGGVYDVIFSKPGYLTSNYNNGAAVVLTNTVVLNNDTLQPGNQVFVSGHVSGNWTNNNTYIVNGDIIIPAGNTLTIQPGTLIKFNGNYSILDTGILIANGTTTNPILFTSNKSTPNPADWKQIEVYNSQSVFSNCILEYCTQGFYMYSACSPVIIENEIRFFTGTGIYCIYASPVISKNYIHDFNYNFASIGIWCAYNAPMTIDCNRIDNGASYGIRPLANITVKNNIISNINGSNGGHGWGIELEIYNPIISNNYIYNCFSAGITVQYYSSANPKPKIINNTITNNNFGILTPPLDTVTIINNIIANNTNGIEAGSASNVSYNLLWNNSSGDYYNTSITGIGQIVGTNAQGNPIDSYYNMAQNPLFVSNTPPVLSSSSPCLNAGNPSYSTNIGFDTSYTCSAIITGIKSFANKSNLLPKVYPNPANNKITIDANDVVDVKLFDVLGKQITATKTNDVDVSNFNDGVYFIQVQTKQNTATQKIIVQH